MPAPSRRSQYLQNAPRTLTLREWGSAVKFEVTSGSRHPHSDLRLRRQARYPVDCPKGEITAIEEASEGSPSEVFQRASAADQERMSQSIER